MKVSSVLPWILLVTAAGCAKKSPEESTEVGQGVQIPVSTNPQVSSLNAQPVGTNDSDIDLPEDLTDEAAEVITKDNLDEQVVAIEKELNAAEQ